MKQRSVIDLAAHHVYLPAIAVGLTVGVIHRLSIKTNGFRQFPSYPHGYIIHVFLGFVAALLGSLAAPAILATDFTAGVFLALGASQFHTVRNLERTMLLSIDKDEIVPRGRTYIEGLIMGFEAKDYLILGTSFIASLIISLFPTILGIVVGLVLAAISIFFALYLVKEKTVIDLATICVKKDSESEETTIVLKPRNLDGWITLTNPGQLQAIYHDLTVLLGIRLDENMKPKMPKATTNHPPDDITITLYPLYDDEARTMLAIRHSRILEAAFRRPRQSDTWKEA